MNDESGALVYSEDDEESIFSAASESDEEPSMRRPITLAILLFPSVMPQGLPAEEEALLMQFLDFYPNSNFEQYQEYSRITREPLLICCC